MPKIGKLQKASAFCYVAFATFGALSWLYLIYRQAEMAGSIADGFKLLLSYQEARGRLAAHAAMSAVATLASWVLWRKVVSSPMASLVALFAAVFFAFANALVLHPMTAALPTLAVVLLGALAHKNCLRDRQI